MTTITSAIAHIASIGARYGRGGRRSGPRRVSCSTMSGPVLGQVAGQEDHQDDLEQLGRLSAQRPDLERQALAVDHRAEDERQQQQAHPGGRPGVLVAAQPAVGADDDAERRRDRQCDQQPHQLDLGQAEGRPEERLLDEVLWEPLHEQQRDAAEHRDRRQQHLVGPTPGQDLGQVGGQQRPEIDEHPLHVVQPERPVDRRPQRQAPDEQRDRDEAEQLELKPAWARADRAEHAWQRRCAGRGARAGRIDRHPAARSSRIRTWPICSSSPKPIGATPSTRRPLTYEPFVLPRSSMYQLRPR